MPNHPIDAYGPQLALLVVLGAGLYVTTRIIKALNRRHTITVRTNLDELRRQQWQRHGFADYFAGRTTDPAIPTVLPGEDIAWTPASHLGGTR